MRLPVALAVLLLAAPAAATPPLPIEAEGRLDGLALGVLERNLPDAAALGSGFLEPRVDATYALLYAGAGGDTFFGDRLALHGTLSTGVLQVDGDEVLADGRSLEAELRGTALIREAWFELFLPSPVPITLTAGKRFVRVAEGLVFDERATGLDVTVEPEWASLRAGVWIPGRDLLPNASPLWRLRVDVPFDVLSSVGLFYASQRFDEDTAGAIFQSALDDAALRGDLGSRAETLLEECYLAETTIDPWWAGVALTHVAGSQTFDAVGVLGRGQAEIDLRARDNRVCRALLRRTHAPARRSAAFDLRSAAVDATWRVRATPKLYPGAFFTWQTGGELHFNDDSYSAFAAVAPYITRPVIFFGAGLGSAFQARGASFAGVNGRGVIAPGATLLYAPTDEIELTTLLAALFADARGPLTSSRVYGQELDLGARWDFTGALAARAELGALRLGDFYPSQRVVWRATAGVELSYPP